MDGNELYHYIVAAFAKKRKLVKTLISIFVVATSYLFSTVRFLRSFLPESLQQFISQNQQILPPALNLIVISVLVFWLGKKPVLDEQKFPFESRASNRFYGAWVCAWSTWFVFYAYLLLEDWLLVNWKRFEDPWIWSAVQNGLNNFQTSFLVLCYFFLAWPIAAAARAEKKDLQMSNVIVPLFAAVLLLAALECFLAGLAKGVYAEYASYFEIFSAFASGVSICLIASRLGSQFVGRVTMAVSLLLVYALIQPSYTAFRLHPQIKMIMLSIALPLKIWMFVVVRWLMTRGGLLFYFHESIKLEERIRDDRRKFGVEISPFVLG